MSAFAATIIRTVRLDTRTFSDRPLYLAVHLSRAPNAEAVLDTFPRLLLNETDEVVSCLDACISAMGRFRTFGLRKRVHLLRAQRG